MPESGIIWGWLHLRLNKKENYQKLQILTKAPAPYTDAARSSGTEGKILAAVSFNADGTIGMIVFLKKSGYGLQAQVYKAINQIQFEPARRNGKPITIIKKIQYNFDIHQKVKKTQNHYE